MSESMQKSVFVAIIGRPNVGKSSLLNRLVGERVAIVTPKPQTTRTRITGILTQGVVQYVFLDTPGIHKPRTRLGAQMSKTAKDTISDGDVALMLFEPDKALNETELEMIEALKSGGPVIAAINKVDTVADEAVLAQKHSELEEFGVFKGIYETSAFKGTGTKELLEAIERFAVDGPHFFSEDAYTDQPEKQIVAEIVREKILLYMQEEIPHGTAVVVDRFHERQDKPIVDIEVTIYTEKKSHKGMLIGKGGQMLKKIASSARQDCEEFLDSQVNLQCWIKVKSDWRDNDFLLNNFGFKK